MGDLLIILPFLSIMIGTYFITLGLWELRRGVNKNQYIKYMFTGLFIVFVLTPLLMLTGNSFSFLY